MLVVFMVGAAIVIAATVITGSSAVGLVVAFLLICLAAAKLWVDYTRWRAEQDHEPEGPAR